VLETSRSTSIGSRHFYSPTGDGARSAHRRCHARHLISRGDFIHRLFICTTYKTAQKKSTCMQCLICVPLGDVWGTFLARTFHHFEVYSGITKQDFNALKHLVRNCEISKTETYRPVSRTLRRLWSWLLPGARRNVAEFNLLMILLISRTQVQHRAKLEFHSKHSSGI